MRAITATEELQVAQAQWRMDGWLVQPEQEQSRPGDRSRAGNEWLPTNNSSSHTKAHE